MLVFRWIQMAENGRTKFLGQEVLSRCLKKYFYKFYKCSSIFQLMFGVPNCNPYKSKSKQYQSNIKMNRRGRTANYSPNQWRLFEVVKIACQKTVEPNSIIYNHTTFHQLLKTFSPAISSVFLLQKMFPLQKHAAAKGQENFVDLPRSWPCHQFVSRGP